MVNNRLSTEKYLLIDLTSFSDPPIMKIVNRISLINTNIKKGICYE